ncbi:MAG: AIM24 family protein [Aestuariivirgaceae bacterium]
MTFVTPGAGQAAESEGETDGFKISLTGSRAPLVEIELMARQSIACTLTAVMYHDAVIGIRSLPVKVGSMQLLINHHRTESARITLMSGCAGAVGLFNMNQHGGRLLCPLKSLLAVGPDIEVTVYSRYRSAGSNDLDIMQLVGKGYAVLAASGEVKHIRLNPGKHTIVNAMAVAAMSATIDFDPLPVQGNVHFARLTGPGQVWLQSGATPG